VLQASAIYGFSATAGPLNASLKGDTIGPLHWGPEQEDAFQNLKRYLGEAPALAVLDITRPFHLYVHEKGGIGLSVLTQPLGPWNRPIAYLSKKLDPVASGCPPCIWALAAMVLLMQEADKLTLGQNITLRVPHQVTSLLNDTASRWMTGERVARYQALLGENPQIRVEAVSSQFGHIFTRRGGGAPPLL
jgi:hypothetical protein